MPPLAAKTFTTGLSPEGKQANLASLELRQPPGLTALGAKGSACDRLRLTGGLRAPPSGVMKHRCAGEVGALMGAIFYAVFCGENRTTGLRPRENRPTSLRSP